MSQQACPDTLLEKLQLNSYEKVCITFTPFCLENFLSNCTIHYNLYTSYVTKLLGFIIWLLLCSSTAIMLYYSYNILYILKRLK